MHVVKRAREERRGFRVWRKGGALPQSPPGRRLVAEVQGKNDEIESSREEIFRVEKERDGVTKAKVAAEHEVATLNQLIDGMRRNSGENSGRGGGGSTVALMSENEAGCSREVAP